MIYGMYAIRDTKAGFGQPIIEANNAVAMRNFYNAFVDKNSVLFNNKKDFDLFKIGEYDSELGLVTGLVHELIAEGVNANEV